MVVASVLVILAQGSKGLVPGSFRSWVGLRMEPVSVTLTFGDCSCTAALQGDYLVLRATDFVAAGAVLRRRRSHASLRSTATATAAKAVEGGIGGTALPKSVPPPDLPSH